MGEARSPRDARSILVQKVDNVVEGEEEVMNSAPQAKDSSRVGPRSEFGRYWLSMVLKVYVFVRCMHGATVFRDRTDRLITSRDEVVHEDVWGR